MTDRIHDVIVIGGGFAGVRAFRDLRDAGRDALLLEARDRLGGRTWYREFEGTTHKIEIGGTWTVDRRQPNVKAEKARYGIGTVTSPRAETWQMRLDGKVRDSALPVEADEIAELEHAIYHLIHDSHRITPGIPYDQQGLDDLDIPFERWMDDRSITGGTKAFLSAFIGLNLGCGPDEVSAVHFLTWITNMGNSPWTMHSVLTEKFAGGSTSVLDAMIAEVGGEVRLSTPVARVEQDADGVTVTTRAGDVMRARTAIVATPLNTWRDIDFSPPLNEAKSEAAATPHSGHSVKPWALVKHAPSYFASWAWDGGMCWLSTEFEVDEGALMVAFAHSPGIVDVTDSTDVASKVGAFLPPDAEVIGSDGHDWNADEFSQGTWMAFAPGVLTRLHSGLMEMEGRVAFAGSDIALRWAGWIEGALESGASAALMVNALLQPSALPTSLDAS